MTTLNLPYPVSTNRYWRNFNGRTVLSIEAQRYKKTIQQEAMRAGITAMNKDVELRITLVPKAKKDGSASLVVIDLDNCLKVTIDALQGAAYYNDSQVKRLSAEYASEPIENGGVIVEVLDYATSNVST